MRKNLVIWGILMSGFLMLASCRQMPAELREINNVLGRKINLEMFEKVHYINGEIELNEVFRKHQFLSLVYLQDGCAPCYPIYVDWHLKLDSMAVNDHYSVLFIIEGSPYSSISSFLEKARQVADFDVKYYTVIDTDYSFLGGNPDIPETLVKRSITIDNKGKIKLIGVPFASTEMKKLFLTVIGQN